MKKKIDMKLNEQITNAAERTQGKWNKYHFTLMAVLSQIFNGYKLNPCHFKSNKEE